jgi:hypothetical protein
VLTALTQANSRLAKQLEDNSTELRELKALLKKKLSKKRGQRSFNPSPSNYCWTHGYIVGFNPSGKAGAQIPQLPLEDDSPPAEIMQYVRDLTRSTRMDVPSHSQPLINAKYQIQVTNYL